MDYTLPGNAGRTVRTEIMTKELLAAHLERACAIEQECVDASGGSYAPPWNAVQFMADLSGKWEYSRLLLFANDLAGFFVASEKRTSTGVRLLHGHRVAFLPAIRTPRLFYDVTNEVFLHAKADGVTWFTAFQAESHPAILQSNIRLLRCRVVTSRSEVEFFTGPLTPGTDVQTDGKICGSTGAGQYLVVREL